RVRRYLLLVSQSPRPPAVGAPGPVALLADDDRLQPGVLPDAPAGPIRHAAARLHVSDRPRLGGLQPSRDDRDRDPHGLDPPLPVERRAELARRGAGDTEPVGRVDARMVGPVAPASLQF